MNINRPHPDSGVKKRTLKKGITRLPHDSGVKTGITTPRADGEVKTTQFINRRSPFGYDRLVTI